MTRPSRLFGPLGMVDTAFAPHPATAEVSILLTQVATAGPTPPALMRDFWRYAASA